MRIIIITITTIIIISMEEVKLLVEVEINFLIAKAKI